mmetsp:Transcript_60717/g.188255  ORF Transcript_60717/g.188255 Transcript_60717/m.188255 type:complete len:215 (+) Transcript_60717:883-1527(+)
MQHHPPRAAAAGGPRQSPRQGAASGPQELGAAGDARLHREAALGLRVAELAVPEPGLPRVPPPARQVAAHEPEIRGGGGGRSAAERAADEAQPLVRQLHLHAARRAAAVHCEGEPQALWGHKAVVRMEVVLPALGAAGDRAAVCTRCSAVLPVDGDARVGHGDAAAAGDQRHLHQRRRQPGELHHAARAVRVVCRAGRGPRRPPAAALQELHDL